MGLTKLVIHNIANRLSLAYTGSVTGFKVNRNEFWSNCCCFYKNKKSIVGNNVGLVSIIKSHRFQDSDDAVFK